MENFDKFIFSQFEKYGYEMKSQILDGQFLFKHKEKDDYWIVSDGFWSMDNQHELYEVLVTGRKDEFPRADKNTSLLMLIDTELEAVDEDDTRFVQIENNPLYFKKYVLPYSKASFVALMQKIQKSEKQSLHSLVMQNNVFEDLKCNEGYAKLLYTIVHKLPFIPVRTEEVMDYQDLLFFSPSIAHLYDSLENFSDEDIFIENLINKYENEEN